MHEDLKENYYALVHRLEESSRLGGVMGILHWDQEVIMPVGASESRAQQIGALAGVLHEKTTHPEMGKLLDELSKADENGFTAFEWCNIREAHREFQMAIRVPKTLVTELAELSSRAHQIWVKARSENKFSDFAPVLKQLVDLKIKWAGYVFPDMQAYDANIDIYERGSTQKDITPVFDKLKAELIPLIKAIQESDYQPDTSFLSGQFSIEKQEALGRKISEEMGTSFLWRQSSDRCPHHHSLPDG